MSVNSEMPPPEEELDNLPPSESPSITVDSFPQTSQKRSRSGVLPWFICLILSGGMVWTLYEVHLSNVRLNEEFSRKVQSVLGKLDASLGSLEAAGVVSAMRDQASSTGSSAAALEVSLANLGDKLSAIESLMGNFESLDTQTKDLETAVISLHEQQRAEQERVRIAVSLAKEFREKGQADLSLALLLNALSRDDSNVELYRTYVEWVLEDEDPSLRYGAGELVERALYTVSPESVVEVAELLALVVAAPQEVEDVEPEAEVTAAELLAQVERQAISAIQKDGLALESRIETLNSLLGDLGEDDVEIVERASDLIEESRVCLAALQVLEAIEMRNENLSLARDEFVAEGNESSKTAVLSAIAVAEMAVNQVWNLPLAKLPTDLKRELMAMPSKFRNLGEEVQQVVDEREIAAARQIWDAANQKTSGDFRNRIEARQEGMSKAVARLEGVRGAVGRNKSSNLVETMSKVIADLRQDQWRAYQSWALKTIEEARAVYEVGGGIRTDGRAERAVMTTDLRRIDLTLLGPEVNQFFGNVFAKLMGEVGAEKSAEFQREMAFPSGSVTKRKLEDF